MAMSRELKVGISGGVISSLVVIYMFQPLADATIFIMKNLAKVIGQTYFDRIFVQAAILEERNYGFYLLAILFLIASYGVVFVSYKILRSQYDHGKKENPKLSAKAKRAISIVYLLFVVGNISFGCAVLSANHLQLELITTYKQHMRIIKPYINPSEEAILLSKWSQIKGKQDYLLVMAEINNIAIKNKITLPKNTLYALDTL